MPHPVENDLALLAGGEASRARRFLLERHVRACDECQAKVAGYQTLRSDLLDQDLPDLNWNALAADMRANIRLGLEAGACVRDTHVPQRWKRAAALQLGRWNALPSWGPALTTALVLVLLLVGSGIFAGNHRSFHPPLWGRPAAATANIEASTPVLQSNRLGVEFRTGQNSLTLLNHHGNAANQTVSAQGDIGTRYVDGENGSVTINHVYLQ